MGVDPLGQAKQVLQNLTTVRAEVAACAMQWKPDAAKGLDDAIAYMQSFINQTELAGEAMQRLAEADKATTERLRKQKENG